MTARNDKETIVDGLVRRLAARIVEGELGPGVRLDEQTLAAAFAGSRTPVREALARLAASGLVERRPHRGVVVARLSMERLSHLFEAMTELEGACARFAAERMGRRSARRWRRCTTARAPSRRTATRKSTAPSTSRSATGPTTRRWCR